MPIAQLSEADIHYEFSGPESAPVLVFSNSLGTNYRMWDPQVEHFAPHFRLLRYDTRGHGASSVPSGPYTIHQLSHDVIQLLDFLNLDRVYFCGLSMGGTTGMFLGARHPLRFHRIALCNTAAKLGTLDSWNARIQTVRTNGMKAISGPLMERWFTFNFRANHAAEIAEYQAMVESTNPEGYVANCAAVRDTDLRQTVSQINLPTLVVAGKHDPVVSVADVQELADSIAGSKMVELSTAHLSNVEARDDFNREILSFLQS